MLSRIKWRPPYIEIKVISLRRILRCSFVDYFEHHKHSQT